MLAGMKRGNGRRPQERARRTRRVLFETARAEFSEKGFHGARMDRIAARAGVSKQRIYAHFGNKEALFTEILRTCLSEVMHEERALLALVEEDIPRLAEAVLGHYLAFHRKHPHFWRLLAWENLDGGRHAGALRHIKSDTFRHLCGLYARGQATGQYPRGTSFECFMLTLSALSFFYFSNQLTMSQTLKLDLSRKAVRERMLREMLALLTRGKG